jgi:CO/xanthine dehydrogenase FAD-binding subunit
MSPFEYHRPTSLEEAWDLASATPGSRFIAGGTDLMVDLRRRRVPPPPALVSLRNIPELRGVDTGDPTRIRIGAGEPLADVARHAEIRECLPALVRAISVLASPQIRNVATIGGNLGNASPCADTAPPLLVYEASVELGKKSGSREVPLCELFRGPGATVLEPGEILTSIFVPRPSERARGAFFSKGRVAMDLSLASLALLVETDGTTCRKARVAAGAVAPVPLRLRRAEAALQGSPLGAEAIARGRALAMEEIAPIDDVRASADYRRHIIGVFFQRAAEEVT